MAATWPVETWLGLLVAVVLVALALVAEHYLVIVLARVLGQDRRSTERGVGLPARYNYALGLLTVASGILGWAAWAALLPLWAAAVLVVAMCGAGGPDFIIHWLEECRADRERRAEQAAVAAELESLRRIAAEYPEVAAELARWRMAGNKRHYTATLELLEGAAFNVGEVRMVAQALNLQAAHLETLLATLALGNGNRAEKND
jgi:hypothetical protein